MTNQPNLKLAVANAPHDALPESDTADAYAAFASDKATHELMVQAVALCGWPASTVQGGGIAAAVRTLTIATPPRVLVVDLAGSADATDGRALMEFLPAATKVIAIGTVNDVDFYRDLMAMGVADYLVKPVTAENLHLAIQKNGKSREAQSGSRLGQVVAVVGARGGIGTSTVAINTAWLMAEEFKRRVALVDFDLEFGTSAFALNVEPHSGLREALEMPDRLDDLLIERATIRKDENLFVLSAQESLDAAVHYDPAAIGGLLDHLRSRFARIVVDLPRMAPARNAVLADASEIVIVSELSLTALRDTVRLVELSKSIAPKARLHVVANEVRSDSRSQLSIPKYERALERKIDVVIPLDIKIAAKSVNIGEPMARIASRSKSVKALRWLSEELSGTSSKRQKLAKRRGRK